LSEDITRQSRILYHHQIQERVKKIAPFITFDRDAYLLIAQGERLFWMIDGYTTFDRFPYSEPMRRAAEKTTSEIPLRSLSMLTTALLIST
jgi:hypothetical protein